MGVNVVFGVGHLGFGFFSGEIRRLQGEIRVDLDS